MSNLWGITSNSLPVMYIHGDTKDSERTVTKSRPEWLADLISAKVNRRAVLGGGSEFVQVQLEWSDAGTRMAFLDCFSVDNLVYEKDPNRCENATYVYSGKMAINRIYASTAHCDQSLVYTDVYQLWYEGSGDRFNNTVRIDLHCADEKNKDTSEMNYGSESHGEIAYRMSTPLVCPKKETTLKPLPLMRIAWNYTLAAILDRALSSCSKGLRGMQIFRSRKYTSQQVDTMMYSDDQIYNFNSEELANRAVKDVLQFFLSNMADNGNQTKAANAAFEVNIVTSMKTFFAAMPIDALNFDTYMSIIQQTTEQIKQDRYSNHRKAGSTITDRAEGTEAFVSTSASTQACDPRKLEDRFFEVFLGGLKNMRQTYEGADDASNKSQDSTRMYCVSESKHNSYLQSYNAFCPREIPLLKNSVCGDALDALDSVLDYFPSQLYNDVYDVDADFAFFVGVLIIVFLIIQSVIRLLRLPGYRLMKQDIKRSIHRNRQVRLALEDEYLCREREFRAIEQLGSEEAAHEVLGLLRSAAYREPGLPKDYQQRNRKISQWFAVGSHIFSVLLILGRSLTAFVCFEAAILGCNIFQSLLEYRAKVML